MSPSIVGTYRAMACNNAWANHRLLAACACLPQENFEAARTGFFPSIKATLNHILIIDWFYVDGLEGGWLGPKAWALDGRKRRCGRRGKHSRMSSEHFGLFQGPSQGSGFAQCCIAAATCWVQ
jgi:uncharacterized damage-inducible protein DinB